MLCYLIFVCLLWCCLILIGFRGSCNGLRCLVIWLILFVRLRYMVLYFLFIVCVDCFIWCVFNWCWVGICGVLFVLRVSFGWWCDWIGWLCLVLWVWFWLFGCWGSGGLVFCLNVGWCSLRLCSILNVIGLSYGVIGGRNWFLLVWGWICWWLLWCWM